MGDWILFKTGSEAILHTDISRVEILEAKIWEHMKGQEDLGQEVSNDNLDFEI